MQTTKQVYVFFLLIIFSPFLYSNIFAQSVLYQSPRHGWDFKFKDFVIGAWYGPYASDTEVQLYKDAGFNIIMTGRYMNNDDKNLNEAMVTGHLDLATKYNLSAIFDPYSYNSWSDTPTSTNADPVSLTELEWIYDKFGKHPSLVGILLGDDQSVITNQLQATTNFMRENCPDLMPWICQNHLNTSTLVELGNPIADWQMYPTLYNMDLTATGQMQIYCNQLNNLYEQCEINDLIMWPMFNVVYVNSDNIVRFQIYSSLAYASQGIWYFHYKGGLRGNGSEVLNTYYPAAIANKRVAKWGPLLLDRKLTGTYSTGWEIDNSLSPTADSYITQMSDNLLIGILEKENEDPLAMVVDKRVSKDWLLTPREVEIQFSSKVKEIHVLEGDSIVNSAEGNKINLEIEAGGGKLLRLIDPTPKVIYAIPSFSVPNSVELQVIGNQETAGYWIYYSIVGSNKEDSIFVNDGRFIVSDLIKDSLYTFRMRAVSHEGDFSYTSNPVISSPGIPSKQILIVDGTDKYFSSYHGTQFNASEYGIASCDYKAIENSNINLNDFHIVDWLVGNGEKVSISQPLQENIKSYLEYGGNLLMSGSNLASSLSANFNKANKLFYQNYLKSFFLFHAPDKIESQFYQLEPFSGSIFDGLPILQFDNGTVGTYDIFSPDVIAEWQGSKEGLKFANANKQYRGACNYYAGSFGESENHGKLVNLSVPVESIYPDESRKLLLDRIINFFNDTNATSINLNTQNFSDEIELFQNYPNPFNSSTMINYIIPNSDTKMNIQIKVFNLLGQEIKTLINEVQKPGNYEILFDANNLPSGIYYYSIRSTNFMDTKKMIYLK